MAIKRILPEDVETFSLQTHPTRHYVSSSFGNSTGKLNVFPRRSPREKEVVPLAIYSSSFFHDLDLNQLLRSAKNASDISGSNQMHITDYLSALNNQQISARLQQQVDVIRFTPGVSLDQDALRKSSILNSLYPYYRTSYPNAHYGFTNYHSLNFFTSSFVPTGSSLLYANPITSSVDGTISGPYIPSGAFSFDFWINPKYSSDEDVSHFHAGTILHLSSCYAVSLVTGSSKDGSGKPDKFRLLLQLSNSADSSPSSLSIGGLPQFAFASNDNCLIKNNWHHVTIRWGSLEYNLGSGSFVVDDEEVGSFAIPSASIIPRTFSPTKDDPCVLCVGNYYEGLNAGSASMAYFFSTDTSTREGLQELIVDSGFAPLGYRFAHPLNAEIHDLKIYSKYLTLDEIADLRVSGPKNQNGLLFYLPPFFTKESPTRTYYNGSGGVLETPFYTYDGTTDMPFAVGMAFSVGGHYTNLENYTREFVNGAYPRLWELSGSVISTTSDIPQTANEILYATSSVRKRSLTVLPCDNGTFYPNFSGFLGPLNKSQFVNDLGNQDIGNVSLRHVIPTGSLSKGMAEDTLTGSIVSNLQGAGPSALTLPVGETYTILQRTRDDSSNQTVFFDISNLYYGDRIKPRSFVLTDSNLSGSGGKVRMTIRDDGEGNLYRADSTGSHATWASVGNIFYNEGIVVLKHPQTYFFGKEEFSIDFQGDRNIHVLHFSLLANPYEHVSSSNPSYMPVSASVLDTDVDKRFSYITGINIHDDNLNVIMRTSLAQPIVLRTTDRIMFKTRLDF